jgi:cystathionine gamma-synthase/methionine-gamma-lyase
VTVRLLDDVFSASGVTSHYVDMTDAAATAEAIQRHRPRAVLCESMSNPLLKLADVEALSDAARTAGAKVIVDNTFASPYLLQPHSLGADLVMHSATKYLGGHGDAIGGVVTAMDDLAKPLRIACVVAGAVLGPFEAFLLARGVKTLAVRMQRHCSNAAGLAVWLQARPEVARVYYPGVPDHPQRDLAARMFPGGEHGGMVSFDLVDATRQRVARFIDGLRLILPAPTLGDVTTLVMYPAIASHRSLTPEQRSGLGIGDGLVRLSVGIEAVDDLKADISQALEA